MSEWSLLPGQRFFHGYVADPLAVRDSDGYVELQWPEGTPPFCLMTRELLEELVNQANELVSLRKREANP